MTRIAVFAYSDTGHACMKFLLDRGENVVFVATHRDAPGEARWFPSVAELARVHGIAVLYAEETSAPEMGERLAAAAPELLFSFYYRNLLAPALLALPRLGSFNVHGSLLPKFRGRAPVNWAIIRGEKRTGATLHVMTERADAGPIVDQQAVLIGPDDTALEVQHRVTAAAVTVMARRIEELKSGTAPNAPQDEAAATRFGRRGPEDGRIEWVRTARQVHDLVRAVTHPFPGAFTDLFGGRTYVWRTRLPGLAAHDTFPGQVREEGGRAFVACGDDHYVELLRLQAEGGPEQDAGPFLAGRGR